MLLIPTGSLYLKHKPQDLPYLGIIPYYKSSLVTKFNTVSIIIYMYTSHCEGEVVVVVNKMKEHGMKQADIISEDGKLRDS